MSKTKVILGSEEWCSFPELGIPTIKARVDSELKPLLYMPSILSPFIKK
jgi:ribosomal protein S6--L-glutamate ligase